MPRSPYAGRRPATASVLRVDEKRLVARYNQVANLSQCAREFKIGRRRVRTILDRHRAQVRSRRPQIADGQAVLRAKEAGSITATAKPEDVTEE